MSIPGGGELADHPLRGSLLLFGASRIPRLARPTGQAGNEFKSALKDGYQASPVEGGAPLRHGDPRRLEVLPRLCRERRRDRGREGTQSPRQLDSPRSPLGDTVVN